MEWSGRKRWAPQTEPCVLIWEGRRKNSEATGRLHEMEKEEEEGRKEENRKRISFLGRRRGRKEEESSGRKEGKECMW